MQQVYGFDALPLSTGGTLAKHPEPWASSQSPSQGLRLYLQNERTELDDP